MAAPRKPAGEKHINRWMSFRPDVSAYLDSLPAGKKSQALNDAVASSPGFQEWKARRE